jgi:hypothetical protein
MFKAGDKVRRKKEYQHASGWTHGDNVLTVSAVDFNGDLCFGNELERWDESLFEYKATGTVYIYMHNSVVGFLCKVYSVDRRLPLGRELSHWEEESSGWRLVAKTNWTEGDGL